MDHLDDGDPSRDLHLVCGARHRMTQPATISLIIPCWNDAEALRQLLPRVRNFPGLIETIVADASENGECEAIVVENTCKYVRCPRPNRGEQLNAGATRASGDVLLFHHADTELRGEH